MIATEEGGEEEEVVEAEDGGREGGRGRTCEASIAERGGRGY